MPRTQRCPFVWSWSFIDLISSLSLDTRRWSEWRVIGAALKMVILILFSSLYFSHLVFATKSNIEYLTPWSFRRNTSGSWSNKDRRSRASRPTRLRALSSNRVTHWNQNRMKFCEFRWIFLTLVLWRSKKAKIEPFHGNSKSRWLICNWAVTFDHSNYSIQLSSRLDSRLKSSQLFTP